jgi:hypothetical protein
MMTASETVRHGRWGAAAVLLLCAVFVLELFFKGKYFTLDDGYYYLEIAAASPSGKGPRSMGCI